MTLRILLLTGLLASPLLARPAAALVVTYAYTLEVTRIANETGDLVGFLEVDDRITGHFRIDTAAAPDFVFENTALYEYVTTDASVRIGSVVFDPVSGPSPTYQISIWDGFEFPPPCTPVPPCPPGIGPRDQFAFGIGQSFESSDGILIDLGFAIVEDGASASFIDGLGLPSTLPFPIPVGLYVETNLLITNAPFNGDHIAAEIALVSLSSTAIPEPRLEWFLPAGAALLARSRGARAPGVRGSCPRRVEPTSHQCRSGHGPAAA